ncbi:hypothetical protein CEV31_4172 [Brucella thiophenivorans]|uniref:Uncharacterized protein n=1 Tax=Brucella thiophenivorans TaxID=571255 RepID=A0A256EZ52_9HYPH|nr:hypothetical protein CEV31_4172 [Brucella thiophenivorans]
MTKSNRKFAGKLPVQKTACVRDVTQAELIIFFRASHEPLHAFRDALIVTNRVPRAAHQ